MTIINMFEAKTNLSKIAKMLETGQEEYVIIARNGKPLLRIILEPQVNVNKRLGLAEGQFKVPNNFDDMDIFEDFEEDKL